MPENIPLITKTVFGHVKTLTVKTALKSTLNVFKVRNFFFKSNNNRADLFLLLFFFFASFYRNFFIPAFLTGSERAETGKNRAETGAFK